MLDPEKLIGRRTGQDEKILIVDDEADLRKLLTDYFEINGYFVMKAKDGSEARGK